MSTGGADKPGSGGSGGAVKTPSDFLKSIRGRPVVVKLNSGVDYRGPKPYHVDQILRNGDRVLVRATACGLLKEQTENRIQDGKNMNVGSLSILACLDGYMNIAMEQTEEYVNGQLKNKYGDAFIRGNNVLYISTSKRTLTDGA